MAGNSFSVQLSNQTGVEMQRWWVNTYYGTVETYSSHMNGVRLENGGNSYLGGSYSAASGGVNVQVMFLDPLGNLWSTPGWTYIGIPPELPLGPASVCQIQVGPAQSSNPAVRSITARWASGEGSLQTCFYVHDKSTPATVSILGPAKVSPAVLYLANKAGEPLSGLELATGGTAQVQVFHVSDLLNPRPENVTAQATIDSSLSPGVCNVTKSSDLLSLQATTSGVTTVSVSYKGFSNFVRVTVRGGDRS